MKYRHRGRRLTILENTLTAMLRAGKDLGPAVDADSFKRGKCSFVVTSPAKAKVSLTNSEKAFMTFKSEVFRSEVGNMPLRGPVT